MGHIHGLIKFKKPLLVLVLLLSVFAQELNAQNGNGDFDNDGVVDSQDTDDDNDGILDIDENNRRPIPIEGWTNLVNTSASGNSVFFNGGNSGWNNGLQSVPFSDLGYNDNYQVSFVVEEVAYEVAVGLGDTEVDNHKNDIEFGIQINFDELFVIQNGTQVSAPIYYSLGDEVIVEYKNDEINFIHEGVLFHQTPLTQAYSFYLDFAFHHDLNGGASSATLTNFEITSLKDLDTDQDGFVNSMDLDADGDGCFDVLEAGYADDDQDGVLGTGIPLVNSIGEVDSAYGYDYPVSPNYLDATISEACFIGIVVNTTGMPSGTYEITSDYVLNSPMQNLISGLPNSKVNVELGANTPTYNEVFLKVFGVTEKSKDLQLKIITIGTNAIESVEVLENGNWLAFSPEFYEVSGIEIYFKNPSVVSSLTPFTANLVHGVVYDQVNGLIVSVADGIAISDLDDKLEILGPNGYSQIVAIDESNRNFTWTRSTSEVGKYKMRITLQGEVFEGQFIIK